MIKKFLITFFSILILMGQMPPNIVIDEGEKDIKIRPNISGTEVVLYGVMPSGKKDLIIEVVGPARNITLEEKRRLYGLWLGLGRADYYQVPSYYNIISSKKLDIIADQKVFDKLGLGLNNLPLGEAKITNSKTNQIIFNKNLKNYMIEKGQFVNNEEDITIKSGPGKIGIFSTEFLLPSNSQQGKYFIRYFIFQNGEFISYAENKIDLKQAGFSRLIWLTSKNFPLLYGILAVILSGSLGWLISTIFRRLKIS